MSAVLVRNIGRISYHKGLQLQKELVQIYKDRKHREVRRQYSYTYCN